MKTTSDGGPNLDRLQLTRGLSDFGKIVAYDYTKIVAQYHG